MAKETPLMKQYNQIKSKYPDALLLFRVPSTLCLPTATTAPSAVNWRFFLTILSIPIFLSS